MTEPASGGGVQRYIGLLLMVVSGLWMALSGACGVWMVGGILLDSGGYPRDEVLVWTFMALVVSVFSVAAGFAVFVVGRGLSR